WVLAQPETPARAQLAIHLAHALESRTPSLAESLIPISGGILSQQAVAAERERRRHIEARAAQEVARERATVAIAEAPSLGDLRKALQCLPTALWPALPVTRREITAAWIAAALRSSRVAARVRFPSHDRLVLRGGPSDIEFFLT